MGINLDDPRVRKTRKGLQAAFIRLILRKGYDAISIQEIASEADAARVTFYRHYRDKEELLTDCLNTLYEDLVQQTAPLSPQGWISGYSPVRVLYEHIEAHEDLYRILFSSRGTQTVIERLRHHMAEHAMRGIRAAVQVSTVPVPLEILAFHAASAQIGLAIWWLDHHKPYPASYMAQVSLWLSLVGSLQGMGITPQQPLPPPPLP